MTASQPTLALGLAPPAPAGTCPSCGLPINHRCGPCESAAPNPWQQRQSYVAWTGDCARTALAWAERAGCKRTAARLEAVYGWLLDETPIADPELAAALTTYPRRHISRPAWRAILAGATAARR